MDETIPTPESQIIKPKLELSPYSPVEVWVTLENENAFETIAEIYAYLRDIADKLKALFPEQVAARNLFITQTGKQIRIQTGGFRELKAEDLKQIQAAVDSFNK